MVRACGSYPQCRGFNSLPRYQRLSQGSAIFAGPFPFLLIFLIYNYYTDFFYIFYLPSEARLYKHCPRWTGSSTHKSGEVAQLVRACGSYPQCRGFNSLPRYQDYPKALQFLQSLFFCLNKTFPLNFLPHLFK